MKKIIIALSLTVSVLFFASCEKTSEQPIDTQPDQTEITNDSTVSDISETDETENTEISEPTDTEITEEPAPEIITETETLGFSLIEKFSFPEMYVLEKDEIKGEFGVSADICDEVFAAVPIEYPGIERIFIAKITNSENASSANESLSKTFDTIKAEYIDYLPDEYKKAKDVEIYNKNELLVLIISEDYDSIISFINN